VSQPGYLFSNAQCVFAQIWDLQTIINTQESIQIILWPIPLSEFLTSYQLAVKFHLLTENACFVAPNKCYKPLPLHRHMKSIWLQQLVHHHKFTSRQRFEAIFWVFIWGDQVGVRIKERQSEQSKFSWYIAHGASMKSRVAMFKFFGSLGSLDCCNLITRECRPACCSACCNRTHQQGRAQEEEREGTVTLPTFHDHWLFNKSFASKRYDLYSSK